MSGQRISDDELQSWADRRGDDAGRLARELVPARAEIARLTAERNAARVEADHMREQSIQNAHERNAAESRYDALLAERAGISEAMVERMARAAHFGTDGLDYESAFCRENDAHWQHWWNEDREMHVAIGRNILAALATPIPAPVDREAIRAEAFEEAAKIADYHAKGNRDVIANASPTYKIVYRESAEDCEAIAADIRSAAKTEASR